MATHQLIDARALLSVTAVSKHSDVDGNVSVKLRLDLQQKPDFTTGTNDDPVAETLNIEMTLPHFFHLLAELEEAKAALASGDK